MRENERTRSGSSSTTSTRGFPGVRAARCCSGAVSAERGKSTRNRLPFPGLVSTSMRPPRPRTMPRHTERPRPCPAPMGLVVKNGSNTRRACSSFIPRPLSPTSTATQPGSGTRVETRISFASTDRSGSACTALVKRFKKTWASCDSCKRPPERSCRAAAARPPKTSWRTTR